MKQLSVALLAVWTFVVGGCQSSQAGLAVDAVSASTPSEVVATESVAQEPSFTPPDESGYDQPDFQQQEDPSDYSPPQQQAQEDPRLPGIARKTTEMALMNAQQRLALSQNMIGMAQQLGDQQNLQLCQAEYQMHQTVIAQLQQVLSDSSSFQTEASRQQVTALIQEYSYRADTRDMRPSDQIQGKLAEYVAYQGWKAGTPEGQQAHQANMNAIQAQGDARTARHNQNMANMQAQAASHNSRMAQQQAQADARNAAWSNDQQSNYEQHQRNTHAIYNEYQYNDPNTGQGYWVPMENQNPAVVNSDGTYTELEPYSSY